MNKNEVDQAFGILLDEIKKVVNTINENGKTAFNKAKYEEARHLAEKARNLIDLHIKIESIEKEFHTLISNLEFEKSGKKSKAGKKYLPRGLKTREESYRIPILQTISELGGSANLNNVLEILKNKMKDIFTKFDMEPLPSPPHDLRWRNTAQWCRNTMVTEGLLKADSPRGVWEISDAGRKFLSESNL